jgi:hypothetical protein
MARSRSLRSQLYRSARILGDLEAMEKGPSAYGKRVVRKAAYRKSSSLTRTLLKMFKF